MFFWGTINLSNAQLNPHDAAKQMARGINIGNTMESETEGSWGNGPMQEFYFDDYKNAGFTSIRIPIRWDKHTLTSSPYTIDAAWLNRVEQVIDWGLSRGLIITINAHHEDWFKIAYTDANVRARLDSIWSQVSMRFKDKSDSLLFEIINEPRTASHPGLTIEQLNELNKRILSIIRKNNPHRIVIFSGNGWSNSDDLVAAAIPDPNDPYLMGYYHSYDPYPFGLEGPGTYGSTSDINATKAKFDQVATWASSKNIPVILSEFGATVKCDYNSRMFYYATVVEQALNHNVAFNVWDDGGDFKVYQRSTNKWNEIKDILIYTYKETPTKLKTVIEKDTNITLSWTNRTNLNDSIVIERKTSSTDFIAIAKIAPSANSFYDSALAFSKTYYYRVRTNIKDSIQLISYPFKVTTNKKPVSINNAKKSNELFRIYPNPATDYIYVLNKGNKNNAQIDIYDMLGKYIKSNLLSYSQNQISLHDIKPGVYCFKISSGNSFEIKRVVVR